MLYLLLALRHLQDLPQPLCNAPRRAQGELLRICVTCEGDACFWGCNVEVEVDNASCKVAEESCGAGSEPFWSQQAILQAHIFVFVIAVTHIVYAAISMLLCIWKIRRWRRFEERARGNLKPIRFRCMCGVGWGGMGWGGVSLGGNGRGGGHNCGLAFLRMCLCACVDLPIAQSKPQ